jgi:hypothetical protein
MLAKKVVLYFSIYKEYIKDNNLDNDSEIISVSSLIQFVDDNITGKYREELKNRIKN